jgi:hypothetical protein
MVFKVSWHYFTRILIEPPFAVVTIRHISIPHKGTNDFILNIYFLRLQLLKNWWVCIPLYYLKILSLAPLMNSSFPVYVHANLTWRSSKLNEPSFLTVMGSS